MGYSPRGRPILGPLVLIGAGAVIAYVPLRFEGLLSVLSIFGALGGLVVGLVLGLLGGNICIAWRPAPEE
jgi:hypothetical protein